jgi:hypothetical protein
VSSVVQAAGIGDWSLISGPIPVVLGAAGVAALGLLLSGEPIAAGGGASFPRRLWPPSC